MQWAEHEGKETTDVTHKYVIQLEICVGYVFHAKGSCILLPFTSIRISFISSKIVSQMTFRCWYKSYLRGTVTRIQEKTCGLCEIDALTFVSSTKVMLSAFLYFLSNRTLPHVSNLNVYILLIDNSLGTRWDTLRYVSLNLLINCTLARRENFRF